MVCSVCLDGSGPGLGPGASPGLDHGHGHGHGHGHAHAHAHAHGQRRILCAMVMYEEISYVNESGGSLSARSDFQEMA